MWVKLALDDFTQDSLCKNLHITFVQDRNNEPTLYTYSVYHHNNYEFCVTLFYTITDFYR